MLRARADRVSVRGDESSGHEARTRAAGPEAGSAAAEAAEGLRGGRRAGGGRA